MYDPYTHNSFRVLGLPAEIEPALLPTAMDPDNLPPLWQLSWMAPTDRSQEQVAKALEALRDDRVKLAYRTWFRKETPIDQKAIKACEDGYWEGAADLWKTPAEQNDQTALQNLAVLYHTRALSSSAAGNPVWAYWTRALDWWNKLVLQTNGEAEVLEVRERIIEDLMKLAHDQASRDSPEDVRLVLEIFRRAGMPDQRREQLQEELLSLELVRIKHLCNKIRDSMPAVFRVGNPSLEKGLENLQKTLEEEVYPSLDWLRKAAGSGKLEEEVRKEVARLLLSLSRAVRGRVGAGDMGFVQRAIELAPEGYHEELLQGQEELKEAPPEEAREEEEKPERGFKAPTWAVIGLVLSLLLMAGGGYMMYQKQVRQEKRNQLLTVLQKTTEQAAVVGAQLAATEKELARQQRQVADTRKRLEANPKPATREQLRKEEARLADVKAKRDALKKQHQGLLSKLDQLQGELQKTR